MFKSTHFPVLVMLFASCTASFAAVAEESGRDAVVQKNMSQLRYEDSGRPFFGDRERGWHWYETPLEDAELIKEPPAPPPVPEKKAEEKPPEKKEAVKPAGPLPMSSEWLKENLPKYIGRAIDNPTDENVRAYLYLQRYAMDKAVQYANASQRVTSNDPYLDSNVRRPISGAGADAADQEGFDLKMRVLGELRNTTGMMFFFRGDCQFCHKQWPLLKAFSDKYKFPVMPVTLDGSILDGMDPKMVQLNRGQAEMLNVTVVPSMILMQPPKKFAVVSYGITAVEGFPDMVIQAAFAAKLIDEKTFMGTRGIKDFSMKASLSNDTPEEIVKDPAALVDFMRKKLKSEK
jgi:conjugal transfer pilus assembly protein TraF